MQEVFQGRCLADKQNPLMPLPEMFLSRMKKMLGEEYPAFRKAYAEERAQGLRLNFLKGDRKELYDRNREQFGLTPIPWCTEGEGFYYEKDRRPGLHPFHQAGVYYIQEPSAMAVVSLLAPQPGDSVLDLCAAPGGKTTHAAAYMAGKGLLVSNEIHPARAKILSQNVERMGITNAVVINEEPQKLTDVFPEFFDKIIVDAPCSGEGMFRKDEQARAEWSYENVLSCAVRQRQILDCAARMLKSGGHMAYSTCTFSPEENEKVILGFLESHPDFSLLSPSKPLEGVSKGRTDWQEESGAELEGAFRIWPHQVRGEGHFAALLKKEEKISSSEVCGRKENDKGNSGKEKRSRNRRKEDGKTEKSKAGSEGKQAFVDFWTENVPYVSREDFGIDLNCLIQFGEQLYHVPEGMPGLTGLRVLRPGLHLGTLKKNRFEPSHALALTLKPGQVRQCLRLDAQGPEIMNYLAGGTFPVVKDQKGWVLVCAENYSLGWAKAAGGTLKNHYPKGLRT